MKPRFCPKCAHGLKGDDVKPGPDGEYNCKCPQCGWIGDIYQDISYPSNTLYIYGPPQGGHALDE